MSNEKKTTKREKRKIYSFTDQIEYAICIQLKIIEYVFVNKYNFIKNSRRSSFSGKIRYFLKKRKVAKHLNVK